MISSNPSIENYIFNSKYSLDLFLVSTIMLCIIFKYCNFGLSARLGTCNNFTRNTIVCTFGMIFLMYLSKNLSNSKIGANLLSIIGRHSMPIMHFHLLSASIVTISVHYLKGIPWPDTWSFSYIGGWIGFLNFAARICIPLIFSVIFDHLKTKNI